MQMCWPTVGGIQANPKVLGHFLCTNNFGILGRKGKGMDQIQKFLGTFYPDFGEIRLKKCHKSSKKKSAYEKVSQKFRKSGGGGGGKTFLEEVHN